MKKNNLILFLSVLGLSVVLSPFGGFIYKKFFITACTGFFCPSHSENYVGFYLLFLFFGSFLPWFFPAGHRIKMWLLYVLPFLLFAFLLQAFEELIIGLGVVIIAFLLAQGILMIVKNVKRKTPITK